MEITIQVHPHDIRDEGAQTVVKNIVELAGIKTIIAETGTLEERHPYPTGELPHNPVHKVVVTDACFEIPDSSPWFANLPFKPRLSQEATTGNDYIAELIARSKHKAQVLPWVKALNGAFEGDLKDAAIIAYNGEIVQTWLCPNSPLTETYVQQLILNITERYRSQAILIDRLRYPDWSGARVSLERMLTCFCPHCIKKMKEKQIHVSLLKSLLERVHEDPSLFLRWEKQKGKEYRLLAEWFRFRMASISALASRLWVSFQDKYPNVTYWLNLWPPAFATMLGQDYESLGKVCHGAKHFPYHKLGGGADLSALVDCLYAAKTTLSKEQIFQELARLLDLGCDDYNHYINHGLPVDFVQRQTRLGKDAFGSNKIFTGIQIWDVPLAHIEESINAARLGFADGLFFYCYGWASLEALQEVGKSLQGV